MTSFTILDGGMGRELERRGAPFKQPEWSALAMMEAPSIVKAVHQSYINSGSRVITTNSYALVPFHIGEKVFKERGKEARHLVWKGRP
ncbi:homocysteine S-methyltransferase family protein [Marinomonas rhodophyticola]|uniref:Homocysteine S-methyltransferase family protein n=1 Tax=Marinomonas rhodophyticola TaxID=2992803 RepID=A0ABT3KBR8_9GAMM|nr:homocysteine S-methyltransferase family protein [Marinomonas sp. KJ51-3]MCW4627989.1 homocysteine S-methyltransferase family protein [Marinomonas sp. KJ51-3]